MLIKSDTQQLLSTYLSRTLIFIPSFICTSFVRITNLPRVFVRSYRELEITKVTPTSKNRNFFRVELLTGTLLLYSTHLRKPNQRPKAEDALHSSVTDISGKLTPILNCGRYQAVSRDLCLVTHFGTPTFTAVKR